MSTSKRPLTTLFLIESLDGKISTGNKIELDIDKDFPRIVGVKEGLFQYYDIEKTTDLVSFNTGLVQAKVGVNQRTWDKERDKISFVVVDNKPHLEKSGSEYFAKRSKVFYLVTTNKNHPAFDLKTSYDNIQILYYEGEVDFVDVFRRFKEDFGISRITIQTGGTLNAVLLRNKLIDKVKIVIAPCLIGGRDTPTLVDGKSLSAEEELTFVKSLKLTRFKKLKENYVLLEYDVINETRLEQ